MIEVTRLNGTPMIVNSDLIKIAEASPDTMLTLIHGEKLIVKESCAEIVEKVLAYRARLLAAIAARGQAAGSSADLHRLVALTSLNPEAVEDADSAGARGRISTAGPQNTGRAIHKNWPVSNQEIRDR
jgi:flagellar protein FlbD